MKNIVLSLSCVLLVSYFQSKTYAEEIPRLKPKNIIIFIGDGCGQNAWKAHDLNEGIDNRFDETWVKNNVATQSLTSLEAGVEYDDAKANGPDSMNWRKKEYTDSAAAGTALSTGTKTYNGRINLNQHDSPLLSFAEIAKANGKSTGIISTVQISHATPATFGGAHNISRKNYKEIGTEMLSDSVLDLLIGAGHPYYNGDGSKCAKFNQNYDYVGGKKTWQNLAQYHWTLLDHVDSFKVYPKNAKRILGLIPNRDALDPEDKLQLSAITCSAIDYLATNPKGFFIMVEGGAIDRANHINNKKQMLKEMKGFTDAIHATCKKLSQGKVVYHGMIHL